MSKRIKHISTTVDEDTWNGVMDAGNLWGESIASATFRLVQRGLLSLDKELGSKTPIHIKISRINQTLNTQMTTKQKVTESYRLAKELEDTTAIQEIEQVAKELNIPLMG